MIGSRVSVGPEFCHQVARSCRPYRRHQNPGAASLLLVRTVAWYKNAKVQKIKKYKNTKTRKFFSANICKNTNTRSRSMPTTKTQVLLCCLPTQSMNSRQEDGRRDPEFLMNLPKSGQINSKNSCIVYFV